MTPTPPTKSQWERVLSILLGAAIAILAVFGWVINPAQIGTVDAPEARVREKISIDARDDAMLYYGADLIVYSDDHTTEKLRVDGATGNVTAAGNIIANGIFTSSGSAYVFNNDTTITGTLNVNGATALDAGATITGDLSVSGATALGDSATIAGDLSASGAITVGGDLVLEGVAFSGPTVFGSATDVVSGTTIAHGLGTTPTVVLLTASGYVTTTPVLLASDDTDITVGFGIDEDPPAMTVHWLAGR